jgi:hypothetical protein
VGSKTIDAKAKPEKQQKNLEKAVAKLLKDFPQRRRKVCNEPVDISHREYGEPLS